jgi:hypothetical protein
VDTRTGVEDKDYQVPFRFTGKIDKLTVKLVPLKAAEERLLQQKAQESRVLSHLAPCRRGWWQGASLRRIATGRHG